MHQSELFFLKDVLSKCHLQLAILDPDNIPNQCLDHGFRKMIGFREPVEHRLLDVIQSAKEIYAFTKTPIALENLPRTCLLNTTAEILTVAEKVEGLRICLDVNHFLRERTEKAITNVSKLIITTHISDHDYANERHWLPKEGKIDWMKLLSELEKSGYNGVFNYEVKAEYTLAQIKDNYEALFEEYNR